MRRRRLELHLTQREAARRIAVDKATLEGWEVNRTNPGLRALPGVIAFLGHDPFAYDGLELGPRLKAARRARGLSIQALAREFGVDPTTIRNWELGKSVPSARYFPRIIDLVGEDGSISDGSCGERLRAYRRRHGLTQEQLAKRIGVRPGTPSGWERGKRPQAEAMRKLLESLLEGKTDAGTTTDADS